MSRKLFTLKKENWINMKKILLLIVGIEYSRLFELTFKDEHGEERTHQFVSITANNYANGFAHWPDCKYCKERGLLCTH